ncbi:glutathione S-transferase family protein [Colwelliaceae bacterium 6471]
MIKLFGFDQAFGVIDASPFVVKVNLFLRMVNIDFKVENHFSNLKKSPKNKLPFIQDEGKKIGDSHFILSYLTQKYQLQLDNFLTEEQKAQALLYAKAVEESLYWCLVYSRWAKDDTWRVVKDAFFSQMPVPFKWFIPPLIRKSVIKNLHGQGIGRHSETEVLTIADEHFSALSTLLGDKDYFFGPQPSSFDAVAYAMLCQFISVEYFNNFNHQAKKHQNLVRYCQRIEDKYYSE